MRQLLVVCLFAVIAVSARRSQAATLPPPTVFDGAYQGLLVGGTAGLVYGAGIGALSGAVVGLTLGIVDMSQGKPGRNGYVMRDGLYGAGLGAVLGGIAGGLAAISTKKGEHVLLGGSIGVLSGACLGMTVGFIEGYQRFAVAVSAVEQVGGSYTFVPAVSARF
jgi:hypothetical protein